jgi:hypothetical protein
MFVVLLVVAAGAYWWFSMKKKEKPINKVNLSEAPGDDEGNMVGAPMQSKKSAPGSGASSSPSAKEAEDQRSQ